MGVAHARRESDLLPVNGTGARQREHAYAESGLPGEHVVHMQHQLCQQRGRHQSLLHLSLILKHRRSVLAGGLLLRRCDLSLSLSLCCSVLLLLHDKLV